MMKKLRECTQSIQVICMGILAFSAWTVSAQTLTAFRTDSLRVAVNSPVTAFVQFQPAEQNWCGFYINWGDGKEPQSFRIGKPPDLSSPVSRQRRYERPGTYTLSAYGDTVIKGLNSAQKCEGKLQPIVITVFDPKEEAAKQQAENERKANEQQAKQVAAQLELEKQKLEVARLELENKKKELELEKQRLNDPVYQKQQAELEQKRVAEEKAQAAAEEKKRKQAERLAEEKAQAAAEEKKRKQAERLAEEAEKKRKQAERLAEEAEKKRVAEEKAQAAAEEKKRKQAERAAQTKAQDQFNFGSLSCQTVSIFIKQGGGSIKNIDVPKNAKPFVIRQDGNRLYAKYPAGPDTAYHGATFTREYNDFVEGSMVTVRRFERQTQDTRYLIELAKRPKVGGYLMVAQSISVGNPNVLVMTDHCQ